MVDLIGSQRVERRRPVVSFYNGTLSIEQHPAHRRGNHKRSRSAASGRALPVWFRDLFQPGFRGVTAIPATTAPVTTGRTRTAGAVESGETAPGREKRAPAEEKPEIKALKAFLRSILPPLFLLVLGIYFFFFSPWSLPAEAGGADPRGILREDSLVLHDMASYAGVLQEEPVEGEDIPLDLMETFAWQTYAVKRGDSVYKIAQDHAISMDAIIAGNGLTNARRLYQGQDIRIPNMDGIPYTVRRGDSLLKISASMGVPLSAILDANDLESDTISPGTALFIPGARMRTEDLKLALGELFVYPLRGRLTSPYGWRNDPISGVRRYHAALDLAAAEGTMIKAAMDGRVATVGNNATYGKFVILSHADGYQTLYAHMSVVSIRQGAWVAQGAKIGEVGSTGYSTGPHLHFAIYKNGRAVNPLDFIHP